MKIFDVTKISTIITIKSTITEVSMTKFHLFRWDYNLHQWLGEKKSMEHISYIYI